MPETSDHTDRFDDAVDKPEGAPQPLWRVFVSALWRLWDDEAIPLAGNIAFRTILALFPFLVFLTALAGFFGDSDLSSQFVEFLLGVAPPEIVEPLVPEIHSVLTRQSSGILSIGVLLTIWAASGGVDSVRVALNRAYGLSEHRSTLRLLVLNTLFVVCGAVVMIAVAFLIVLAPVVIAVLESHVTELRRLQPVYQLARYPFAILLLAIALTLAHILLPARWHRLADLWPGIAVTVVVWILLAVAYSIYLANFARFASMYAGLAGIIAALFFLYMGALVLIFGGEVNRLVRLRRQAHTRE